MVDFSVGRRMSRRDTRNLEFHGNQWRVVVPVPRPLRKALGLTRLKRGLKTDSLSIARARRHAAIALLQREIAERAVRAANDNPLWIEAIEWQECVKIHQYLDRRGEAIEEADAALRDVIKGRTEQVEAEHGKRKAQEFSGIATGNATPLMLHMERWLQESGRKERTKVEDRYALKLLAKWVTDGGWPQTVEGFTRRIAADFVSECFIATGIHHRTAKKRLSSLSSYWVWLGLKGLAGLDIGENPWLRQPMPKPSKRSGKRPFTDDEIGRLLYLGQPEPLLFDFMMIAALSGMREDEIACLSIGDVRDGMFRVTGAKTEAGDRTVPIHSVLKPIITKRLKGSGSAPSSRKSSGDWLFDELPKASNGRRRYMPLSKRFQRYRIGLGIDEKPEGHRQSNIDFHSFRRWFCHKAEHAGVPESTTAAVVGHARKGMSYGRYSPRPSVEQMRECIEAVKLPAIAHGRK